MTTFPDNVRVAVKGDDVQVLLPGELHSPHRRSGYEICEYRPVRSPLPGDSGEALRDALEGVRALYATACREESPDDPDSEYDEGDPTGLGAAFGLFQRADGIAAQALALGSGPSPVAGEAPKNPVRPSDQGDQQGSGQGRRLSPIEHKEVENFVARAIARRDETGSRDRLTPRMEAHRIIADIDTLRDRLQQGGAPMSEAADRMPRPDREPLPFERPDEGLYLHDRAGLLELAGLAGIEGDFLPVQRFMEMQRERDELRKTLALINAALVRPAPLPKIRRLVLNAGFTSADGEAMCSVIDWTESLANGPKEQG